MPTSPVPAAQYLRMSTEEQQYSLDNQAAAIQRYAEGHGFVVVQTYVDSGRSGVILGRREGLKTLLQDVVSGNANFRAILVYDVSRWGRFQDADEAAHYEFLCKQAATPVYYCAEQFVNDGTLSNSLLKALKRSMAAEYSRELGVKVFEGKKRLAQLGFRVGGQAGYGLRRMMVSADRGRKQKLEQREYKSLTTDRVILVPGPGKEVASIREIFSLALRRRVARIVRELNGRGVAFVNDKPWNQTSLHELLRNPKYYGCNVWGRTAQKLRIPQTQVPTDRWTMVPGAFAPLIDKSLFDRVQAAQKRLKGKIPKRHLLGKLKRLLAAKGRLTQKIINQARGIPHMSTYVRRFGSVRRAYGLIGYEASAESVLRSEHAALSRRLRTEVLDQIERASFGQARCCFPFVHRRPALDVDSGLTVSVLMCHQYTTGRAWVRWQLIPHPQESRCITLVCLMGPDADRVQRYLILPCIDRMGEYQIKGLRDPWLKQGTRLHNLREFSDVVRSVHRRREELSREQ